LAAVTDPQGEGVFAVEEGAEFFSCFFVEENGFAPSFSCS